MTHVLDLHRLARAKQAASEKFRAIKPCFRLETISRIAGSTSYNALLSHLRDVDQHRFTPDLDAAMEFLEERRCPAERDVWRDLIDAEFLEGDTVVAEPVTPVSLVETVHHATGTAFLASLDRARPLNKLLLPNSDTPVVEFRTEAHSIAVWQTSYRGVPYLLTERLYADTPVSLSFDHPLFKALARIGSSVEDFYWWHSASYRDLCSSLGFDPDQGRPQRRNEIATDDDLLEIHRLTGRINLKGSVFAGQDFGDVLGFAELLYHGLSAVFGFNEIEAIGSHRFREYRGMATSIVMETFDLAEVEQKTGVSIPREALVRFCRDFISIEMPYEECAYISFLPSEDGGGYVATCWGRHTPGSGWETIYDTLGGDLSKSAVVYDPDARKTPLEEFLCRRLAEKGVTLVHPDEVERYLADWTSISRRIFGDSLIKTKVIRPVTNFFRRTLRLVAGAGDAEKEWDWVSVRSDALRNLLRLGKSSEIAETIAVNMRSQTYTVPPPIVKDRAIGLIYTMVPPIISLRDRGELSSDLDVLRSYLSLDQLWGLYARFKEKAASGQEREFALGLDGYFSTLPGFNFVSGPDQAPETLKQHDYLAVQLKALIDSPLWRIPSEEAEAKRRRAA